MDNKTHKNMRLEEIIHRQKTNKTKNAQTKQYKNFFKNLQKYH